MPASRKAIAWLVALVFSVASVGHSQQTPPQASAPSRATDPRIERLKTEALAKVEARAKQVQEMVDMVFSFGELGMQEFETSKYLTGILEQNGFTVERGVAGIPTAWVAKWGSGKPVIALGSDIDCIPQASNKPAVAWHEPMIEGAPGHGEGHNSGQAVNIAAAIAVKEIMQREKMPGIRVDTRQVAALRRGELARDPLQGHGGVPEDRIQRRP